MSKGGRKSYTERCTFCGKSRHMVDSLVAGPPDVYICNECVDLCNTILIEENRKSSSPRGASLADVGKITLLSDGTPWRPQVHVSDVARAFLGALEAPRHVVHDAAFNVGRTDENYQIREIASLVEDVVSDSVLDISPGAGPDTRTYRVDFSKLADTLPDFAPTTTVRAGVAELAAAFAAADLVEKDFPRYTRLDEIQRLVEAGRLNQDLQWTQ